MASATASAASVASTAQATANGAVSVNSSHNTRLTALEKTASTTVGGVRFRRCGKTVTASLDGTGRNIAAWATVAICTIPTGYRPNADYWSSASSNLGSCSLRANADGKIYIVNRSGTAISDTSVDGEVTYFTNDA